MTQHMIANMRGVADIVPEGRPMSIQAQASFERQARVLERDLDKLGLTIPASGKLSVASVDAALKAQDWPIRKRMEFKSTLHMFQVLA